jgi:hypothetical protein
MRARRHRGSARFRRRRRPQGRVHTRRGRAARGYVHPAEGIGTKLHQQLGTNADSRDDARRSEAFMPFSGSGGDAQRQSLKPYSTAIAPSYYVKGS